MPIEQETIPQLTTKGAQRRAFAKWILVSYAVRSALPLRMALARGMTYIDDEWGPMALGIRSELDGHVLSRLHDDSQGAQVHDFYAGVFLGKETHLQEEVTGLAAYMLASYPHLRSSLGYCHAEVNSAVLGEIPADFSDDYPGINRRIKKQLLMLKHAADYLVPINTDEAAEYLLNGQWIGIYLATQPGIWIRVGLDYNPRTRQVLVSSYGFADQWLPIDRATGMYIPVHPGTDPIDERIAARLGEQRQELEYNRYLYNFPSKRVHLLDHLVYHTPLPPAA